MGNGTNLESGARKAGKDNFPELIKAILSGEQFNLDELGLTFDELSAMQDAGLELRQTTEGQGSFLSLKDQAEKAEYHAEIVTDLREVIHLFNEFKNETQPSEALKRLNALKNELKSLRMRLYSLRKEGKFVSSYETVVGELYVGLSTLNVIASLLLDEDVYGEDIRSTNFNTVKLVFNKTTALSAAIRNLENKLDKET